MTGIQERNKQKLELANHGYSMKYIDEWPPKTTLFRHKPVYDGNGNVVKEIGDKLFNLPGNPDFVLLKSKIGLFPWPPSNDCTCKWCSERNVKVKAEEPQTVSESIDESPTDSFTDVVIEV
tara:strand:- start:245 stop:607 length:363 start_codon:yes stop_codon:yes gene_type:complete